MTPHNDAPSPKALHVVLVEPDIPWNTGNVGRTCLAMGAQLHLVRPLGFRLDERYLKRAGLDYWQHVNPRIWPSWSTFEEALPDLGTPWLFSAEGQLMLDQIELTSPTVLIFGRESTGLRSEIREKYRQSLVRIPMVDGPVRSLNLSTSAALGLYEARRQLGWHL